MAQALPIYELLIINFYHMNHFNICPNCIHLNDCCLTAQKDKVWSCSEFDEATKESRVPDDFLTQELDKNLKLEKINF